MTNRNEALRLADRISPETDWYEFDQVTWCNEAAALLRQQAEQLDAELCNREVLDKMLTQCIAERDQLRAEVESLRADAERLDHIEKHARCDPKMDGQHVWWPTNFKNALRGPNLRAAIDHARTINQDN